MQGTGAGWDSCLYRIFVVGGIFAVVGGIVASVVLLPDNSRIPLYIGIGGMAVFMVLLIGYWTVQIVFKNYGSPKAPDLSEPGDISDIAVLKDWNTLFSAMAIAGGDPEEMKRMEKQGRSSLVTWFMWAAVIGLCPIALMIPYALGLVEWSMIRYGVFFYLGLVIVMWLVSQFSTLKRSTEASEAIYFAPLGLKIMQLPEVGIGSIGGDARPMVRGGTVVEGARHGRAVKISLGMSEVNTEIRIKSPGFVIKSQDGSLIADAVAPQAIHDALRGLRKAKRWEGLEVYGDTEGIVATRPQKGVNMWLYDLWLLERIASEIQAQKN